jgi:uroporphyrinogen-III synthase
MDAGATLSGLRVVVTRPAAQADTLCRLLEVRGAELRRLPLQAIEPVRQPQQVARRLAEFREAAAWIFTSANAVKFALQLDGGVWPPAIAVGAATSAALQARGLGAVAPASSFTSEGVLALPQLQSVEGQRLLIVTGEGGRDEMRETLSARGAVVERAEVYRRVALPHPPEAVARALSGAHAVVVTSGEALTRLQALAAEAGCPRLLRLQLVVPSQRVVELAQQLGFTSVPLVPEPIADAAYVQCLEHWWRQPPQDP